MASLVSIRRVTSVGIENFPIALLKMEIQISLAHKSLRLSKQIHLAKMSSVVAALGNRRNHSFPPTAATMWSHSHNSFSRKCIKPHNNVIVSNVWENHFSLKSDLGSSSLYYLHNILPRLSQKQFCAESQNIFVFSSFVFPDLLQLKTHICVSSFLLFVWHDGCSVFQIDACDFLSFSSQSSLPVFAPEMFCPCVGLAEHRNVYLDKKSGIPRVTLIFFPILSIITIRPKTLLFSLVIENFDLNKKSGIWGLEVSTGLL